MPGAVTSTPTCRSTKSDAHRRIRPLASARRCCGCGPLRPGGGKSLVAGTRRPDAPRAFADPPGLRSSMLHQREESSAACSMAATCRGVKGTASPGAGTLGMSRRSIRAARASMPSPVWVEV